LRGLAACAVLFSHVALEFRHFSNQISGHAVNALNSGRAGVDVFFVISGFVMIYVTAARFGSARESWRFLIKRLIRIAPVYWFYTTAMAAIVVSAPALLRHSGLTVPYVIASYLFYPFARPGGGEISPLLDLGWTLNYEMYFYVLFAVAMLFTRRVGLTLLTLLFVAMVVAGPFVNPSWAAAWYWSRPIILEFLAGVAIGLAFLGGVRVPRAAALAMMAVAVAWFMLQMEVGGGELRVVRFGLPAAVLVGACTLLRPRAGPHQQSFLWGWFLLIGDASYSLYLVHMFAVRLVTRLLEPRLLGNLFVPVYFLAAFATALLLALASYRLIELPTKAWLERLCLRRQASGRSNIGSLVSGP
jgi:exopolysaccharide production protein ExoZ